MQGKKTYQEKLFISFQLSDYIPADNFYKRLNDTIDLNFVYGATAKYYGSEGQKSIDPVIFMKLMLIGYLENLSSDRKIVSTSRMRMDILYFLGYDLDEELPWHSTLSRTRQLYGMELFETLFKQVLKLCIDKGMVSGKRQAVDSAYIHANASMDSLVEREILKDASQYSRELNDNVEESSMRIVPITKKPTKRLFDKSMPMEKRSNKTHGSISDPEARISFKPGKAYRLTYTSQVSVDTAKHVITGIEAVLSDRRDSQCLPNLVERTVSNLKENGLVVDAILADTNYSSMEALKFMHTWA
ncbi:transposase [Pedobacter nototheniae]|uniref:transposase n=1 Tax=Pedobacter nototheniae TaxID=2488994 RepID=UPI001039B3D7|nr:transposase [Pedobacter nototheniae]